jgi:hypothetical protein
MYRSKDIKQFYLVLYGGETWSLSLRAEYGLSLFENKELKIIFRPKKEEVTGGWIKLHNGEIHNLYSKSNIIIVIK